MGIGVDGIHPRYCRYLVVFACAHPTRHTIYLEAGPAKMTNRSNLSFWEFTKRSARHATFEFFRPLVPPETFGGNDFRRSLKAVSKAPEPAISSDGAQVVGFARDAEPHVNDYVDRSREVVDRGRAQWEE